METLFDEHHTVRFEDCAGLSLESGKRDVIAAERHGFVTDGVAPVVKGLQDIQKDHATDAELLHLEFEVFIGGVASVAISQVLLVSGIEIAHGGRYLVNRGMDALTNVRLIFNELKLLLADRGAALAVTERHGEIDPQ